MRQQRSLIWVLIFSLLLTFLPAGGASAAPTGAPSAQGEEPVFRLELPRIVVTIDQDGFPSAFGLSVADIQRMTGMDLSMLRVPADTMQLLAQAGIQHFEVVINGQGLFLFANGSPLPYLSWDQESLTNLASAMQAFQVPNAGLIGQLVPFLQYISIPLVLQFPLPEGATAVPLRDPANFSLVQVEAAKGEVAGQPPLILRATVEVNAEGVPTLVARPGEGVSIRQIQEVTGFDLSGAQVPSNLMAQLASGGIQHLQLQTLPYGLHFYMNGKPLLRLAWDQAHLATLADLLSKLTAGQPWAPLVGLTLPGLQAADIRLTVRFPLPSGAQELPLHEFEAAR
ncbi:MAG: hypothetical protein RML36_02675 [Anaerolineae bacterium]|nr:hypothetical protein [Anaerolineae bacterium]MDW8098371.1 hypothetical protein [Anaerolineae bacterium]